MTAAQNRVEKLWAVLSPKERAALRLKWWKADEADPPGFYRATPDYQIDDVNRLTRLFNAAHHETTWYVSWLNARLDGTAIRLALLGALHLWSLHANRIREQLEWFSGEPITQADYDRRLAEAREELLPLDVAADLLMDDEPDSDDLTDDGWDERIREIAARLRHLIHEGVLLGEQTDGELQVRAGSFYDWRHEAVPVIPEHGLRLAVFPDDAAAEVERLSRERAKLREILDEAPHCPPADGFVPPADGVKRTASMLADGLLLAIAAHLTKAWSELLAIDKVVGDVAGHFAGEEPIHPEARDLLEEVKASALKLVEDLRPDIDLVLPDEPDEDAVRSLASMIGVAETEG